MPTAWKRRKYQQVALVALRKTRALGLLWARQCRKSTTLGDIAFDELSSNPGRRVIAASASLLMGTEIAAKAVTSTEQAVMVAREAAAIQAAMLNSLAESAKAVQLVIADARANKALETVKADDFAELYQAGRLEMRLYHSRSVYSRLQVIAPNPATARGWSGTVLRDECGYVKQEAELQEAVKPIIDTDPSFKIVYASNLPFDDSHPWFTMTLPADPSLTFPANPAGHLYRGATGLRVHRVSIADAYAAGHVLYDDDGQPMTLERMYSLAVDKGALKRSYQLIHEYGGASIVDLLAIGTAQARGVGECAFVEVHSDLDFALALVYLAGHLTDGVVGIGYDVATTTRGVSNPSAVTITEAKGIEKYQRLVLTWKTKDPAIARQRLRLICKTIAGRKTGGPARRLCIDGTSEKYYAVDVARDLMALVPVEVVVSSESVPRERAPSYETAINYKTWLGDLYSAEINDAHYWLPPEQYLKDDHRLVTKDRGRYDCEPQADGKHGDTFDSGKLAQHALASGGPVEAEACATGTYNSSPHIEGTNRLRPDPHEDDPVDQVLHI
jgi:hypothetical protein